MKREPVGKILARLDSRVEDRPFPEASGIFDVTKRYRVVCAQADLMEYAKKLDAAKLIAGEWQVEHDRFVEIIQQQGKPRRWKATLEPGGDVRLDELFNDGAPEDAGARRRANLAKLIDRESKRRTRAAGRKADKEAKKKKARAKKFCSGIRRGVVIVNLNPPRPFSSIAECAAWIGLAQRSTLTVAIRYRAGRCGTFHVRYADEILKDQTLKADTEAARAQLEAAREAHRMSGRDPEADGSLFLTEADRGRLGESEQ